MLREFKIRSAFIIVLLLALWGFPSFLQAGSTSQLDLTLSRAGEFIVVTLINRSEVDMRSPGLLLTYSDGAEGLYLSFRDSQGKEHPLCAMVDQVYVGNYVVPPRGFLQKNLSTGALKRMFCLKAGRYDLTAKFVSKDLGSSVFSFPITFK